MRSEVDWISGGIIINHMVPRANAKFTLKKFVKSGGNTVFRISVFVPAQAFVVSSSLIRNVPCLEKWQSLMCPTGCNNRRFMF